MPHNTSLHFNGHFSSWTWVSRYQNVFILNFKRAKDDGDGGDDWSYKTCKAPVKSSPPKNQHPDLTGWIPLLSPYQQCQSTDGKICGTACKIKLKGSVKESNKFHNYETEKITRKASDAAEYIELFGSSSRDRHARHINVIL